MKPLTGKTIFTTIALVILTALTAGALMFLNFIYAVGTHAEEMRARFDACYRTVVSLYSENNAMHDAFDTRMRKQVMLTASELSELVQSDENGAQTYTGPRILSDSFVIELHDGVVSYPEGLPQDHLVLDESIIREALHKGTLMQGDPNTFRAYSVPDHSDEDTDEIEGDEFDLYTQMLYLTAANICADTYVVQCTSIDDYMDYIGGRSKADKLIASAEEVHGGSLLLCQSSSDELLLANTPRDFPHAYSATELGITREMLREHNSTITILGKEYLMYNRGVPSQGIHLVYLVPLEQVSLQASIRTFFTACIVLLFSLTIATYVLSSEHRAIAFQRAGQPLDASSPSFVQTNTLVIMLLGTLLTFFGSSFIHAVGALRDQVLMSQSAMTALISSADTSHDDLNTTISEDEEEWFVQCAQRLAMLSAEHPEVATQQKLQEYCDILNVDYIMLFDQDGKQVVGSNDYVGFRVDYGQGENSEDFRRLLMGVPSVVHRPSLNELTGLTREMIGVTVPTDNVEHNGALIMAIDPAKLYHTSSSETFAEELDLLTPTGSLCLAVDSQTGTVKYASESNLVDQTIDSLGLSPNCMTDGYLHFQTLQGTNYFLVSKAADGYTLMYLKPNHLIFQNVVSFGMMSAGLSALLFLLLRFVLFSGYTADGIRLWAQKVEEIEARSQQQEDPNADETSLRARMRRYLHRSFEAWKQISPFDKARGTFVLLLIVIACCVYFLETDPENPLIGDGTSLLPYILNGDWRRGFNLFAVCSILIWCAGSLVFVFVARVLLKSLSRMLNNKGKTIVKLTLSLVEYGTALVALYQSLTYLGFPVQSILASLSLASFALTLGAKDLVADILAGIAIIFEDSFRVGDYIEVGDFRGTVSEIGVRSTILTSRSGSSVVIRNSTIGTVVNRSHHNIWAVAELRFPLTESLPRIEQAIKDALPTIFQNNQKLLISCPVYKGVTTLSTGFIVIRVTAECTPRTYHDVERLLNQELRLVIEREGIEMR